MQKSITLKELRPQLPKVIQEITDREDRYVISKRGKPVAVMMSVEEYEGLMETLDILLDPDTLKSLEEAQKQIARGQTISHEELMKKLNHDKN